MSTTCNHNICCHAQTTEKIPNESICLDCVNYAEKLRLTSDGSFTFIEGRQTFYDKPSSSKDNTFSKLDKEVPVFDIERLNSVIDRDIEELVTRSGAQSLIILHHLTNLYFIINLFSRDVEAVIFQTLPLPQTKNEKTTVANFLNFCGFVAFLPLHFIILRKQKSSFTAITLLTSLELIVSNYSVFVFLRYQNSC